MAEYAITLTVEESRKTAVEKKLKTAFGEDIELASVEVEKVETGQSRAARLNEARDLVQQAMGIVEQLKDEMEQWQESIPENLQGGTKASEVEEAKDALDTVYSELEAVDFDSVNFPGMF